MGPNGVYGDAEGPIWTKWKKTRAGKVAWDPEGPKRGYGYGTQIEKGYTPSGAGKFLD